MVQKVQAPEAEASRRPSVSDRLLVGKRIHKECRLEVGEHLHLSAFCQPLAWLTAEEWYRPEAEGFHLPLAFCRLLACRELGLRQSPPLRGHHQRAEWAVGNCQHLVDANLRQRQRPPHQQANAASFVPELVEVSGNSWGRAFALLS